jgi:hypothetical protein
MRKALAGLIVAILLRETDLSDAAYVIKLRNGNEYLTNRYWQAGAQVLFDADDGIFGVATTFVSSIEKTDKVVRPLPRSDFQPTEKPAVTVGENTNDKAEDSPAGATRIPAKQDENDPILKEFGALKAQSDGIHTMSRAQLDEYVQKVVGLISKIQNERKTNQFRQEYSELNGLANRLEDVLKER